MIRKKHLIILIIILSASSRIEAKELSVQKSIFGKIGIKNKNYFKNKNYPELKNHFLTFDAQFALHNQYEYWFYNLDSEIQISSHFSEDNYFLISKGNLGTQIRHFKKSKNLPLKTLSISLGFYKKKWSWVDDFWNLGIWNNQNLHDLFNIETVGVPGSVLFLEGNKWSYTLLVGGISIPNEFLPSNRAIIPMVKSNSRWSNPKKINFEGWIKKYNVKFDSPQVEIPFNKVFFNTIYLMNFFIGELDKVWLSTSYANKPLSRLSFRVIGKIPVNNNEIKTKTGVYYVSRTQRVIAVESGLKLYDWEARVGVIAENINSVFIPKYWNVFKVFDSFFGSISIIRKFNLLSFSSNTLTVSFLTSYLTEDASQNKNSIAYQYTPSLNRFLLKDGASFGLDSYFFIKGKERVFSSFKYHYSILEKGGWIKWELGYLYDSKSKIYLRLDILGSYTEYRQGFYGKFGHNDRVELGINHVF